jgi:hypothetical protein
MVDQTTPLRTQVIVGIGDAEAKAAGDPSDKRPRQEVSAQAALNLVEDFLAADTTRLLVARRLWASRGYRLDRFDDQRITWVVRRERIEGYARTALDALRRELRPVDGY